MGTLTEKNLPQMPNTLRIFIPRLVLDGRYSGTRFILRHRHVIIQADTVEIRNRCFLPGQTVEILARCIMSDDGSIDVSGVKPDPIPPDSSLDGKQDEANPDSVNGSAGQAGTVGNPGGTIKIIAGCMKGKLTLISNGSQGGTSQSGGNGITPKDAKDGDAATEEEARSIAMQVFDRGPGKTIPHTNYKYVNKDYEIILEKDMHNGYFHPLSVVWWVVVHGEKGQDAHPGGNAGSSGRPGDGGTGGCIEVNYVDNTSEIPQLEAHGGPAGMTGSSSQKGLAGKEGKGGKYYIARINGRPWMPTDVGPADADNSVIRKFVEQFSIKLKADDGKPANHGTVPKSPEASSGRDGFSSIRQVTLEQVAERCDKSYLEFISDIAAMDVEHDKKNRAIECYRWVEALTQSTQDNELINLHWKVSEQLLKLGIGPNESKP